jgi:hypothetical protein
MMNPEMMKFAMEQMVRTQILAGPIWQAFH